MNQFDKRVQRVVDQKAEELTELFQSAPSWDPEPYLKKLLDDMNALHNLASDIKDEVRKVEKMQQTPEEKKKKPKKKKKTPNYPNGGLELDWRTLMIEDLRALIEDDDDPTNDHLLLEGPTAPGQTVWDAFADWVRKVFSLRIPGISPDYWETFLEGIKQAPKAPPFDFTDLLWIVTHPDDFVDLSPSWWETFDLILHPQDIGGDFTERYYELKRRIEESRAQENKNTDDIKTAVDEETEEIKSHVSDSLDTLFDELDRIITQCCANTSDSLNWIKNKLNQPDPGETAKQDTLLVRKKIAEIDSVLEELRRELRLFRDFRSRAEAWFSEQTR